MAAAEFLTAAHRSTSREEEQCCTTRYTHATAGRFRRRTGFGWAAEGTAAVPGARNAAGPSGMAAVAREAGTASIGRVAGE